jgi:hypothetical protein
VESLRSLVDALKLTAYDLLAVLLPGALAVRGLSAIFPDVRVASPGAGPLVPDALAFTALAYAAGLVAQGAGGLVSRGRTPPELLEEARKVIRERYRRELPDALVLDFCLTKLEGRRGVYDKFVALRGMARALVVTSAVLGVARAAVSASPDTAIAVLLATALVCGALLALYRHYAPLGARAVVGMFVASESELRPLPEAPGAAAGSEKPAARAP